MKVKMAAGEETIFRISTFFLLLAESIGIKDQEGQLDFLGEVYAKFYQNALSFVSEDERYKKIATQFVTEVGRYKGADEQLSFLNKLLETVDKSVQINAFQKGLEKTTNDALSLLKSQKLINDDQLRKLLTDYQAAVAKHDEAVRLKQAVSAGDSKSALESLVDQKS